MVLRVPGHTSLPSPLLFLDSLYFSPSLAFPKYSCTYSEHSNSAFCFFVPAQALGAGCCSPGSWLFFRYCDKIPIEKQFRKEKLILAHNRRVQLISTRKSQSQEQEAVDHIAPTIKKQRPLDTWCSADQAPGPVNKATHVQCPSSYLNQI